MPFDTDIAIRPLDMFHVGRLLMSQRHYRGWTQQELARRTGYSITTIAQVENGRVPRVAFATICQLAQTLGLSLDSLLMDHTPASL